MNKQVRSILAQETTKTSKIRQLYLLGIPRAEIARMVTNGNYGFVVNALRRMNEREAGGCWQEWFYQSARPGFSLLFFGASSPRLFR